MFITRSGTLPCPVTGAQLEGMLLVYVDESGSPSSARSDPNYPLFVMAGCVIDSDDYVRKLLPAVSALKFRHLRSDSVVLHESEIRKRLGAFSFKGDADARTAFLEGLCELISAQVPHVLAAAVRAHDQGGDAEYLALQTLWREFRRLHDGPSHWTFERRGKREDAAVGDVFAKLSNGDATHEFVPKARGLAGLEMADMLARPIGLSVLRPYQPNRAMSGMRDRMTIVVV